MHNKPLRITAKPDIYTLGELVKSGYISKTVKQELRENLIKKLQQKENVFKGIFGYDDTVIPELQRAILSEHHILLLGLRGQAKTRLARLMVQLLDEWIPVIEGSELNDDPLNPISKYGIDKIQELGEKTPISWLHRDDRYTEKLATPDVSIADLIGDADPIKAATLKLPYSDERVIHFGLIPRSHRCLFVINELPDLQARIQVSLFNILQEGDIQIRGFKIRLPLDVQFIFTANPEDYTNRGSIVTPLKDRIDSQIITHYPESLQIGKEITRQEARIQKGQENIYIPEIARDLVEEVAFQARKSEFVDAKSGVSARLTIAAVENLLATAQRRMLLNNEVKGKIQMSDFDGVVPAITGKVELVYEGEQEGAAIVARNLISKAIREQFLKYFPDPEKVKKVKKSAPESPYQIITDWFESGQVVDFLTEGSSEQYQNTLNAIPNLEKMVRSSVPNLIEKDVDMFKELLLFGLAEFNVISRSTLVRRTQFADMMSGMFKSKLSSSDSDDPYGYYEEGNNQ